MSVQPTQSSSAPTFNMLRITGKEIQDYGIAMVSLILYLVIATYFLAYTFPSALTTLSTAAFTSVNAGVVVIFQVLVPLSEGFVVILLFIALVSKVLA